jgi:hypothetical protein
MLPTPKPSTKRIPHSPIENRPVVFMPWMGTEFVAGKFWFRQVAAHWYFNPFFIINPYTSYFSVLLDIPFAFTPSFSAAAAGMETTMSA